VSSLLDESRIFGQQKEAYVRGMFARVASRYDLLNSLLSLRVHHRWRDIAARELALQPGACALDVCTGTADLAIRMAREVGQTGRVIGVDFCRPMLQIGQRKTQRHPNAGRITLVLGDALQLPFASNCFQGVAVAFGIRNVVDIRQAFAEMWRVLKPGGRLVCLEFSHPRRQPFRTLYAFYFHRLLPCIGGLLSHRDAYTYLPESVRRFPERERLAQIMQEVGFIRVSWRELTFGIVCVHSGVKP
jgi:demethylmenaquinone methyltransferase/2-methoxy-6-polyprenyl-1,4-benzoquinol methylase